MSFLSHLLPLSLLSFIILCNSMFHPLEAQSLGLDTDKEALISFKSQISLQSPNPLSSWDTNTSPCNWTGIVCNRNGLRVISVNLSNLRLLGSLSPHIGNLSFLQSLELQNNQLSGPIPDQISNLFRLQVLNMSTNSLQGSIPLNISNLSNLRLLDLTMNKITGTIPGELSLLTRLQVLKLGKNSLSGQIPPSLSNLSSLFELSVATNSISGMIPSDLSKLRNLKVLDLMLNNLTGTVPSTIYNMSSLENFAIASNQLSGTIPRNVGDTLPNLFIFNNCFNKFTGTIPRSLHNLTNVRVIRMAGNLLEGTVPPGLGNLPLLEMYNIGFNKIVNSGDDNGPKFISSLTNSTRLQFLAIDGNLLSGKIPESVGNLSKDLKWLYMGGNQIYGEIPASIGRLNSLNLLNLSHNAITGVIPPELGQLEQLKELGLAGNQISGGIPDSLGNLKNLNLIDLSGNKLEGQIPTTFGNFQRLQTMDLSNNRINKSIPKEILGLSSLSTILNLSHNFLSGDLSLITLQSVDTIDLSRNNLSGNIPSSIRNCKSLQKLFLSNNMFSGTIPVTLGEVKGLDIIDLSHNNLSGPIPSELENLQASLNLSFNNLEEPVPCGGVFSNPDKVQLEGNPKLFSLSASACKNISLNPAKKRIEVGIIIAIICAAIALILVVGSLLYLRKSKQKKTGTSQVVKAHQNQLVSYEELRDATENFKEENLLGTGGFGSVFKGCLRDGSVVAIKVFDNFRTGSWKSFVAECEALRNVRHRNLVKLITSCSSLDHKNMEFLALIYEFLSLGSLDEWIHGKRKNEKEDGLNILERLNIAIDVASALDYLHNDYDVPVVHCDLKPSNILLDANMTAKVGDFGLARLLIEKIDDQTYISSTHALKGSVGYIPPEYGVGSKPSTEGDAYSYGIMLLELFTGKCPTHDCFIGEQNLKRCVQSAFPTNVPQVTDPTLLSLMDNLYHDGQKINIETQKECLITILGVALSCTVTSPEGRISMRDALSKLKAARTKLQGFGHKI